MSGISRPTAGGTISAAARRSICCGRAPATRVRSWTPLEGPYHRLSDHPRRIDLDRRLSDRARRRRVRYRPTCHYAYHPCDDAVLSLHELAGKNWQLQSRKRLMMDEIIDGIDELGVLLMGHARRRLLVRLAAVDRRGARDRAAQQRHLAAGDGGGAGRHGLGDRAPARGDRRAGGDGFRAHPRDRRPLSRRGRRRLRRLDAAASTASACSPRISTATTRGSSRTSGSCSARAA